MKKLLHFLLLALVVVGCSLPAFSKAEAAKIAVLPIVTSEDEENAAVSRRVWNEVCMTQFKFPEFDMVDDTDLNIVLDALNYNTVAKDGVNEALMRQVMAKTNADMAVMMVMQDLSLEPVIPYTKEDLYRLTQKGSIMLVNNISKQVKVDRINDYDDYDYAVTVRSDFLHDQFRNTVIRELKKVTKVK